MMRSNFDQQLRQLHQALTEMGAMCEQAIAASVSALLDGDKAGADTAMERERDIDRQEREVEALCMKLLLQQQPVAGDLRAISSALKMISDMERIGDQAADIAEITRHTGSRALPGHLHIREMTKAAVKMVAGSVASFVESDLQMAKEVMIYDDVVDQLFDEVKEELTALIRADSSSAGEALDWLMIAKYLERIGDNAVNIDEWVTYTITGSKSG